MLSKGHLVWGSVLLHWLHPWKNIRCKRDIGYKCLSLSRVADFHLVFQMPTCPVLKELYCSRLTAIITSQELRETPAHLSQGSLASSRTGCSTVFTWVAAIYAFMLKMNTHPFTFYMTCWKKTTKNVNFCERQTCLGTPLWCPMAAR